MGRVLGLVLIGFEVCGFRVCSQGSPSKAPRRPLWIEVLEFNPKGPCIHLVYTYWPPSTKIGTTSRPKYLPFGHMDP